MELYIPVTVRQVLTVFNTSDDIRSYYRFDHTGRVISSYTSDNDFLYGSANCAYEDDSSVKKKNSISSVMQIGGMTTNYLNNPGFEESNDDARPYSGSVRGMFRL